MALLSDTNLSTDMFQIDLESFLTFLVKMVKRIVHHGFHFDQYRRSLDCHMMMIREEGYPELADSLVADLAILERES